MAKQTWEQWLRTCSKDPTSPARVAAHALGALTGQDRRALAAIACCWELYAGSDTTGQLAALEGVRRLLPAMQPGCRYLARELVAFTLDWTDRDRVWLLVQRGST